MNEGEGFEKAQRWTITMIVVTFVSILAVVFLPALSIMGRGGNARRAHCLSNLKQIALACHLYAQDNHGAFPVVAWAKNSNAHFYLLLPTYMTTARPFICPVDEKWRKSNWSGACRAPARDLTKAAFDVPNVNSYSYVSGLMLAKQSDSPLGGDNLMDVTKANDLDVKQFQQRSGCSTKGSNHGTDGSNVVFADGHGEFNSGTKLRIRWVDGDDSTTNIKNPNGL